ncbi:uncharacterized protein L201_001731 [Kwoniella dendrophila CBS 6074]|uniref:Mid2 domain-containing protein n=1 Tax=Kwoniella dendrophila CBS 6074 TaxID=1295534 RepID=A0AAX4JNA2_9TREE
MLTISLLRVLSLIVPYLIFISLLYQASAQSTITSKNAIATGTTPSPSTTVYTGIPSLIFGSIPTMTACQSQVILWQVYNEDPSKVNITLYAMNDGVDQSIPSPSTTAVAATQTSKAAVVSSQTALAASPKPTSAGITSSVAAAQAVVTPSAVPNKRQEIQERTVLDLNITLVTQYANHGWGFNPVKLPEGRYYILGVVDDGHQTSNKSNVFSVVEGDDTACLSVYKSLSASATGTATKNGGSAKITATSSSSGIVGGSAENDNNSTEKKGISGGAIGGIVVGVIAGLAALALLLFCCKRKRRNVRNGSSEEGRGGGFGGFSIGRDNKHRHSKMPSDQTTPTPSDLGHSTNSKTMMVDKNPIAMTPVALRTGDSYRSDKSDEEKGAIENQPTIEELPGTNTNTFMTPQSTPFTASSFGSQTHGRRRSDPFTTPTLGELPSLSPIYSNDEIGKFSYNPDSTTSNGSTTITQPAAAMLPKMKSISRNPSKTSNQGQSPSDNDGTAAGVGLGISSVTALKPSESFTASSTFDKQSKSEPGTRRSSLHGLGNGTPPSPDPNQFAIPTTNGIAGAPGLGRSTSSRRKPVPSLGPELRTELARQGSLKDLKDGKPKDDSNNNAVQQQGRRKSYKLMPDPPMIQE